MYRFLLTIALTAALVVPAGVWLDGRLRETRRREQGEFELRVERELDKPISLAGIAGEDQKVLDVLRHVAGQIDLPMVYNRARLPEKSFDYDREQIHLPNAKLSLRSVLGILSHQVPIGYYADQGRLVITSRDDAEGRLSTRVYPLPQLAGPEQPFGADLDTWIEVLSVVIEPDSWDLQGGPAEIVPIPGALVIRQSRRAHDRLKQFFRRLENDPPTPDAQADYLSSFSTEERRIFAALEKPCDFQCTATSLYEAVDTLSWKHRIPIVLRQNKLEEAAVDLKMLVTLKMKGASLRSVLRSLLEPAGLTYVIRDDVLQVTTAEDAASDMRPVVYDVQDLVDVKGRPDFDSLQELIETTIEPDSWGEGNSQNFGGLSPGLLALNQTDSIHEGTARLLTQLRAVLRHRSGGKLAPTTLAPAEQKIAAALEGKNKLDYHQLGLQQVVDDLAEQTGLSVRFDEQMLAGNGIHFGTPVHCDLPLLPLKTALRRLLDCKSLARAELAWCIRDESLVLTTKEEADSQHELLVMDVRAMLLPQEDDNSFEEEKLVELFETIVRPPGSVGAASIAIFQSLLVSSAARETNEKMQRLVQDLSKYRDESLVASQKGQERKTAPIPIGLEEVSEGGLLLRIHPVEDLLGAAGPAAIEELEHAVARLVLEDTNLGGPGELIPIPPGALLVSHTPAGHELLQRFLAEARQHVVPGHPAPPWLVSRDKKRRELDQALSSREQILPAKDLYELGRKLWQVLQRQVSISRDVSLSELYRGHQFQDLPPDRGVPLPGSPPRTIREQLAGLGLAVVETESRLELALAEEDVRLAFYDVNDLLSRNDPYAADELDGLFDGGVDRDAAEWFERGSNFAPPYCFRGWVIIRAHDARLKRWERLLSWLREQPEMPRAERVFWSSKSAEARPLVDRLLRSKSVEEQLYLAFVLQFAAPPEDGFEDLAVLADSLAESQDPLLALRLKDVLHRWVVAQTRPDQEAIFDNSPSPLLRKAAVEALSARLGASREKQFFPPETDLQLRISARTELSESELAELELALERRQPPPIYRTGFESRLFAESGRLSPPQRFPFPRKPVRKLPPWRQPEPRVRGALISFIPVVG